jgi:putative transposase
MIDFYRRNLPHWIPSGAMYFITFRLTNSLPREVIRELQAWRERERAGILSQLQGREQTEKLYKLSKKYFSHFDAWLDRCLAGSPRWLTEEKIAQVVADELHSMDGERYRLLAYCLMPNHVHLVIDTAGYEIEIHHRGPTAPYPLADTLKRLKGRTARRCNLALGRSGPFWHHESYDHIVRNQQEYERIVAYILNDPVKAGLVENWEDWKLSFVAW